MTAPHASVESSAFHLCELVTKGKTDWQLVSHGAKGTKFSKLQTAFRSTPFLCVLCAPSRQRTRWIISTGVLERQNSRSRGQVFDIGILKIRGSASLGIEPQRSQGSQRTECSATHPRGEGTLDALLAAGKLVQSKRGLNEVVERPRRLVEGFTGPRFVEPNHSARHQNHSRRHASFG